MRQELRRVAFAVACGIRFAGNKHLCGRIKQLCRILTGAHRDELRSGGRGAYADQH